MDFDAGLLLFLFIFFVLPLIQRALGGAKKTPPGSRPGQPRPGVPPGRPEGRARLPEGSRTGTPDRADADEPARAEPQRAADLIPDDLWEVLTGERRSPSQRQRQPVPEPEPEAEWGRNAEEAWHDEAAAQTPEPDDEDPYQQSDPPEAPWRREHEETVPTTTRAPAPITASASTSPPATARPSPYAIADAVVPGPPRARPYALETRRRRTPPSLSNRSDLKRAFVLREVLGPPKALE